MKKIVGLVLAASVALSPVSAYAYGSEGSYFKYFKHYKHHHMKVKVSAPKGPNTGGRSTPAFAQYMGFSIGCATLSLLIGSAVKPLTRREAHMAALSCFLTPWGAEALMQLTYKKMPGEV